MQKLNIFLKIFYFCFLSYSKLCEGYRYPRKLRYVDIGILFIIYSNLEEMKERNNIYINKLS